LEINIYFFFKFNKFHILAHIFLTLINILNKFTFKKTPFLDEERIFPLWM